MAKRFEGARWSLIFGAYEGVEKFAIEEAQRYFQNYQPYVMRVESVAKTNWPATEKLSEHLLIIGTKKNNAILADLIKKDLIQEPKAAEGYSIKCMESPWNAAMKLVVVLGHDAAGVLYGVEHLGLSILPDLVAPVCVQMHKEKHDKIANFSVTDSPKITNRGFWTWGYVIYDYRRYINNMARMRLNMLTIWNDEVPLNIHEIVAHAHSRGVKIIMGFHWGWGHNALDLTKQEDRDTIRKQVIEKYERDYAKLGIDGIYFQTLTEHSEKEKGNVTVATAAKMLVNETAGELLSKHPGLLIQFGLHATSIGDRCSDLATLDPRVTIVWEDAGDIPFPYLLSLWKDASYLKPEAWVNTSEKTLEYSKKIAAIRGGKDEFAIVPKGWTCLDWQLEFENHENFILGERDAGWIKQRVEMRRVHWEKTNTLWLERYKHATHYYREIYKSHAGPITATGLIEDGNFEAEVQPSVSLFAEMLWNPVRTDEEILRAAYAAAAVVNRL